MRKLATIRTIADIRPIPNADAIEVALVDGWECVVAKKDNFQTGDKVVYIEIDSIVPERPEFEFLRDRKFRVKTIKLVLVHLMKCGHVSNAYDADNAPVCVICVGLHSGYNQIDKECSGIVGLEGREARCNDHKPGGGQGIAPSRWELPFFKYCPDQRYDEYYCGCWGWD